MWAKEGNIAGSAVVAATAAKNTKISNENEYMLEWIVVRRIDTHMRTGEQASARARGCGKYKANYDDIPTERDGERETHCVL